MDERSRRRNICAECLKKPVHFDRAFAPCAYEGVVKELLHAFKYSGKDYLCDVLAGLMIEFIRTYRVPADSIDMLIPVPLHAARQREREFNQAELLSRRVAAALGNTKVEARNLVRTRHTRTQTELASDKRHENVAGCFRLTEPEAVAGKNIMLVDDVLTTGATLSEASRVLKEAGAGTVIALTVAN